eukprot:TRINITY_DN5967_c0_g1_i1.p2 TRINITY_DN5967_c0_g1~~TRINITY_DN5967_c0_g1_i1.p2  ORF type:complete len:226 (+),score=22.36 TRINITY_DN5967_c0_g1_i1:250-927(+)
MNPKLIMLAIQLLKDKNFRKWMLISCMLPFVFVFIPVMYFFVNDPISIGLENGTKDYKNEQPIEPNISQQEFLDMIAPGAVKGYKKHKIFASITMAQAILESNWGKSGLTQKANNLFGIKAYNWTGASIVMSTGENYGGINVTIDASFRAYSTPQESIEDHAKFLLENSTYKKHGVFDADTYEEQAEALKSAGYATDPKYPELLVSLIRQYSLDKYDEQQRSINI